MYSNYPMDESENSSSFNQQSKRRGFSLQSSYSTPRLTNRQTINMMKLLDRYQNPSAHPSDQKTKSSARSNKPNNRGSFMKPQLDQNDSDEYNDSNKNSPTNKRMHQMLEKELYNLRADLNRLKAIESEQNKKYENQMVHMMRQQQRYPPPNVFFGGQASAQPMGALMGSPMLFF